MQSPWRAGLSARPLLPGDPLPTASAVCLALSSGAVPRAGGSGVWVTENARASATVQLVTGAEAELAPALLATLTLQSLLADVAAQTKK